MLRRLLFWFSSFIESYFIFKRSDKKQKLIIGTPLCWGQEYQEITIVGKDGLPVKSWYVPYAKAAERIIFVLHGRGSTVEQLYGTKKEAQILYDLQKALSADLFYLEYRGYGQNKGRPSLKNAIEDAKLALEFIQEGKGFPPQRIIILGHSLGAGIAINLAVQYPVEALILVSPTVHLAKLIFLHFPSFLRPLYHLLQKFSWPQAYFYNPWQDADRIRCPTFILHAVEDPLIPLSLVVSFFYILASNNQYAHMMLIPEDKHLQIFDLKEVLDILKTMLSI